MPEKILHFFALIGNTDTDNIWNGNTEVRGKWLILNCNILKMGRRRKFKFGENTFSTFPNIW